MHELDPSNDHPIRAEIFRASRMCAPCMDRLGAMTYQASPLNEPLRAQWCASVLANHLMPAISSAHVATSNFGFRELLAVDARLDHQRHGDEVHTLGNQRVSQPLQRGQIRHADWG